MEVKRSSDVLVALDATDAGRSHARATAARAVVGVMGAGMVAF
jgi:hypothetical protein